MRLQRAVIVVPPLIGVALTAAFAAADLRRHTAALPQPVRTVLAPLPPDAPLAPRPLLATALRGIADDAERRGAIVAVTGAAGAGKTTLVRAALQGRTGVVYARVDGALDAALRTALRDQRLRDVDVDETTAAVRLADVARDTAALARPGVLVLDVRRAAIADAAEQRRLHDVLQAVAERAGAVVLLLWRDAALLPPAATHELLVGDLERDEARALLRELLPARLHDDEIDSVLDAVGRHVGDVVELGTAVRNGDVHVYAALDAMRATRTARLRALLPPADVVEQHNDGRASAPIVRFCRVLQALAGAPTRHEVGIVTDLAGLVRPRGTARLSEVVAAAGQPANRAVAEVQRLLDAGVVTLAGGERVRRVDEVEDEDWANPRLQMTPLMCAAYHVLRTADDVERSLDRVLLTLQVHNTAAELADQRREIDDERAALAAAVAELHLHTPGPDASDAERAEHQEAALLLHERELAVQLRQEVLDRKVARLADWRGELARADRAPNVGL